MQHSSNGTEETILCYGTLDGKVAFVSLEFSKKPLEPLHKWEIPEKGSKSSVTCLAIAENASELYIGRSDGNVEVLIFLLKLIVFNFISKHIKRFGHLLKL
jgi:hypothetical protein